MQMICSIFKLSVFLAIVFCGLLSDFVLWHLFPICFISLWWFQQSTSPKFVFMLLCSWYSWRWKCGAVWGPCWIELTVSDYCDLILIWTKKTIQHTCTVYQLSSDKCHTFRHELDDGHTWGKMVGGVIGWSPRILGADITILQYFLFKFPFTKPD